jgi:hypothetical protein
MTTAKKSGTAGRIERLRALAEHPNTPEHERDLARHALDRLLKRAAETNRAAVTAWAPEWQGEKFADTRGLDLTKITAMIRDEIKMLRKLAKQAAGTPDGAGALAISEPIGEAPAEIKIGVRQPHYGAIKISVTGIPENWGWRRARVNGHEQWVPTAALARLGRELNELGNAYNYDDSDTQRDHFDRRYYLTVCAPEPGSDWVSYSISNVRDAR